MTFKNREEEEWKDEESLDLSHFPSYSNIIALEQRVSVFMRSPKESRKSLSRQPPSPRYFGLQNRHPVISSLLDLGLCYTTLAKSYPHLNNVH